jgi:hypothetical protein
MRGIQNNSGSLVDREPRTPEQTRALASAGSQGSHKTLAG